MGTSGSADDDRWIARAEIYSGRPDPSWKLEPEDMAALDRLWTAMKPFAGPRPRPPQLGYRGCHVRRGDDDYFAYGGVVTLTAGRAVEGRADVEEEFERRVLASAPPGTIPFGLIGRPSS